MKHKVEEIERALKLHINYKGISSNGKYLEIMDTLTYNYTGALGIKVSKLLDEYYTFVKVSNLNEALQRLRELEINNI
tara:strand:- start:268 stop:501 length:234 start_codon:yes stop_codon:yes gene_type:complete